MMYGLDILNMERDAQHLSKQNKASYDVDLDLIYAQLGLEIEFKGNIPTAIYFYEVSSHPVAKERLNFIKPPRPIQRDPSDMTLLLDVLSAKVTEQTKARNINTNSLMQPPKPLLFQGAQNHDPKPEPNSDIIRIKRKPIKAKQFQTIIEESSYRILNMIYCDQIARRLTPEAIHTTLLYNPGTKKIGPTQEKIAEKIGLSTSSITKYTQRLIKDGYLIRWPVITQKGLEYLKSMEGTASKTFNISRKRKQ